MEPLRKWIDKAAAECGGQNKLAEKLGVSSGCLSKMKAGQISMARDKCIKLGEICEIDGAALYDAKKATRRRQSIERQARELGLLGVVGVAAGVILSSVWATQGVDIAGFFGLFGLDARVIISAAAAALAVWLLLDYRETIPGRLAA